MFKQTFHIFIAVLLLIATSGVVMHQHYCNGMLTGATIQVQPDDCCGPICGHCHNESKLFKVTDSFTASQTTTVSQVQIDVLGLIAASSTLLVAYQTISPKASILSPPPKKVQTSRAFLQTFLL